MLFCGSLSGRRWAEPGREQQAKGREQSGASGVALAMLTGKPGRFASAISHAKSVSWQGQQPCRTQNCKRRAGSARAFIYFCTKFSFAQLRRRAGIASPWGGEEVGGRGRTRPFLRPSSLSHETFLKHVQLAWTHL